MRSTSRRLTGQQRAAVEAAIREVCDYRGWALHALNVRTNHVHVVVTSDGKPEFAMNSFKSWATRKMSEAGLAGGGGHIWTRHGSTRYLWNEPSVAAAVAYVQEGQDVPR